MIIKKVSVRMSDYSGRPTFSDLLGPVSIGKIDSQAKLYIVTILLLIEDVNRCFFESTTFIKTAHTIDIHHNPSAKSLIPLTSTYINIRNVLYD